MERSEHLHWTSRQIIWYCKINKYEFYEVVDHQNGGCEVCKPVVALYILGIYNIINKQLLKIRMTGTFNIQKKRNVLCGT
jgi:hypothetical protein